MKPKMNNTEFLKTMEGLSLETGNDLEQVGFRNTENGYTIGFYGNKDEEHKLIIDEFGLEIEGKWINCEPTPRQIKKMELRLKAEIKRISDELNEKEEMLEREKKEAYDEFIYGTSGALYSKHH